MGTGELKWQHKGGPEVREGSPAPSRTSEWLGGKSRWIDIVWERLGRVGVFSEPCCGTAVMTLNNPYPAPREVICELNAFICNFYRSLVGDYEQAAYWADWPTNHHDLTARHRWLLRWGAENAERVCEDAEWFDAKAAGFWVWGQSSWIGHGWCDGGHAGDQIPAVGGSTGQGAGVQQHRTLLPVEDKRPKVPDGGDVRDQVPDIGNKSGGQGVQQQRDQIPHDQVPFVKNTGPGGQGVSAQRVAVDQVPYMDAKGGGSGVTMQRTQLKGDGVLDGSRLRPWFRAIAARLARVIILNRSWESALTDSVLQQTPSSPKPEVGVFLDPPYRTTRKDGGKRSTGLYQGDAAGVSDDVATASYKWAVEHGDKYRVAYCMHEGDFDVPDGWTVETMGFSGHRDEAKKESSVDCVIFSPRCVPPEVDPQTEFGW